MHTLHSLSHADAMRVIHAVQSALEQEHKGAAVAVTDAHGELLAFLRTDGCPLSSIQVAMNKAYTAARQREASQRIGQRSRQEGFPITNFGDARFVGWGGGLPIVHAGQVIGAVGVSGLPEDEDIRLAQLGVEALMGAG